MSFLRVAAIRSSPSAIFTRSATRAVRRTTSQPCLRIGQQSGRRGYASATETVKKTSDLPWAASAVIVTAIGTYIALSPSEGSGHGHGDHGDHGKGHDDHAEEEPKEESKEEPEPEPEAKEESSEKAESKESESKDKEKQSEDEKPAKEDSKEEKKADDSSEKSKDDTNASEDAGAEGDTQKGKEFPLPGSDRVNVKYGGPDEMAKLHKGATKNKDDIKHREGDEGKGSTKVRLDSPTGKTIGEGSSSGEGDEHSHKQRGVSNTDTKHSTDPHADPGKSSKGEGTAETAKIKGTVKPDRPQV